MRTVARRVRVLLVLALAGTSGLAAQVVVNNSQTPGDAIKGTGLLMGQVVDGTSGRPIAGATAVLTGGPSTTTVLPTGEIITTATPANPAAPTTAPRQILTNSDGRFLFRELTRGRYTLRITAPGYLAGGAGQTRPGGLMQAVELVTDDEKKGDLVARLWKSASLSGTILDEAGEPVVGLSVRILRRTMTGGVPRFSTTPLTSSSAGATDDRGMYRVSGLQPGEYLVGVMTAQVTLPVATSEAYYQMVASGVNTTNSDLYRELNSSGAPSLYTSGVRIGDLILQANAGRGIGANSGPPVPTDERRIMTYPTQYYPASSTAAHATIVTLGSGDDRSGIDMQLRLVPTVKVTGIVTGPDGPARNTGVKLVPLEAEAFTSETGTEIAATATDATGAFTMLGVTPGQYTLKILRVPRPAASSSPMMMNTIEISSGNRSIISMSSIGPSTAAPPSLPTEPSLWANMPVTVGDSDLAGLAVSLRPGIRINGRIEFDGTKEKPTADQIQRASLGFTPIAGQTSSQISLAAKRVEQNGRFSTVGYPPGRYLINASIASTAAPGSPGNWTFRNATIGGRDVSNEGLDLTAEDIADLVITFTDQTTDLTGRVNDVKGVPDKDALVIVFPADTDSWKRGVMNARRMRSIRAATTGGFNFAGLPPGAYYLAALPDATTSSEWQDPKILEALMGVATRIVLGEGEKKTQDLTTRTLR